VVKCRFAPPSSACHTKTAWPSDKAGVSGRAVRVVRIPRRHRHQSTPSAGEPVSFRAASASITRRSRHVPSQPAGRRHRRLRHHRGVAPENNAAERTQRHVVSRRRISGGTDSKPGSRFEERMLTAAPTCRQQGRGVLEYLASGFEAARNGQAIPSLLPATQQKSKSPDSGYTSL
jgi:hypothetical protein